MAPNEERFTYSPVTKEDLVSGSCRCFRCKSIAKDFYIAQNILCVDCVLELDPPKWKLILATTNHQKSNRIEPTGTYDIWDDTYKRQEQTLTLKELIECGWFVRKVVETCQLIPKRTIKKVDMEYHGELMCLRFKDHYEKLGLKDMEQCRSPFCEFVYEKRLKFKHL